MVFGYTGQHNTEKRGHIHASSEIRTRNSSVRALDRAVIGTGFCGQFLSKMEVVKRKSRYRLDDERLESCLRVGHLSHASKY